MSRSRRYGTLCLIVAALSAGPIGGDRLEVEARQRSTAAGEGTISGAVTADQGVVRAFRVQARDTVNLIMYTVYTNKGQYHIYNLPASSYQVQVMESGFESPVQSIDLQAGATRTVDIALKMQPPAPSDVEYVDYDTLYPPGKGRDLLEQHAFGFHGPVFHRMSKKTRAGWASAVGRMFHVPGQWPQASWMNNPASGASGGYVAPEIVSTEERALIIDYLAANFGISSKKRELKQDPLIRDEQALSKAIWIQYELPPLDPSKSNGSKANGLALNRGVHDVRPSTSRPGTFWLSGSGSSSMVGVDTRILDPKARTREWVIEETRKPPLNPAPNTVVEKNGHVYWTELKGDSIGDLDLASGEFKRYPAPTAAQNMHGIEADSKGKIWYVGLIGTVGRFDPETKKFEEWLPAKGSNLYELRIDKKDRVWAASTTGRMIVGYDQKTRKWTQHTTPADVKRIDVDSKSRVWANAYFGNSVVMFDPDTGKMTEYKLPLKYALPYEVVVDEHDDVWLEEAEYQIFVKLDPDTKTFTYFPYPNMQAHTPDIESDGRGGLWSGLNGRGSAPYLTGFKPNGNVPRKGESPN